MPGTEQILHPFATEMRHLTSALNVIASDMIRDRALAKKLDDDPDYFRKNYTVTEDELTAMRERNMIRLYELGLHPFLLVRFAGMMGILEYWQALGAPGRGGGGARHHLCCWSNANAHLGPPARPRSRAWRSSSASPIGGARTTSATSSARCWRATSTGWCPTTTVRSRTGW